MTNPDKKPQGLKACPGCDGKGKTLFDDHFGKRYEVCEVCNGTGGFPMENKQIPPTCPLCGGEVKYYGNSEYTHKFACMNDKCEIWFIITNCTEAEALSRFAKRSKSVEAKILEQFKEYLDVTNPSDDMAYAAIEYLREHLTEIEKELKD